MTLDELAYRVVIRKAVCNLVLLIESQSPWGRPSSSGSLLVLDGFEVPEAALSPSSVFDLIVIWSFSDLLIVLGCIESSITISAA